MGVPWLRGTSIRELKKYMKHKNRRELKTDKYSTKAIREDAQ
jgi:hypothetical protein